MAGRQTADIVFCLDSSGSMSPVFRQVCKNITTLVNSLNNENNQFHWDVRFDFLSYSNGCSEMMLETMYHKGIGVIDALYKAKRDANGGISGGKFFTSDIKEFSDRVKQLTADYDEATGYALDIVADFPFRDASTCHRVVILLTDEPIETGVCVNKTQSKLMDLANKLQDKKISLFMVTPPSDMFDTLSQIDKCEWTIDTSNGLTSTDFTKLMQTIGKSVSVSQTSSASGSNTVKPLFNQKSWKETCSSFDSRLVEIR